MKKKITATATLQIKLLKIPLNETLRSGGKSRIENLADYTAQILAQTEARTEVRLSLHSLNAFKRNYALLI